MSAKVDEKYELIRRYVSGKLAEWSAEGNETFARAQLAQLRRGIGRRPGDMPELWGILFKDMPQELMAQYGEPTYAEWATYTALTMYALHQQGRSIADNNMHRQDVSLGKALARLIVNDDDKDGRERIAKRLNAFATAYDMTEAAYYLRGLIQFLRTNDVGLDYVQLALDLYKFQFPERAPGVRLKWGQDFYMAAVNDNTDKEGKAENNG